MNKFFTFQAGQFICPAELDRYEMPQREWFIEGLVPHKAVTLLSGDGGLGKSLLMQQLATCSSLDKPFLGMPVRKCHTLALFAEDSNEELWRRQQSICNDLDITLKDCYSFSWLTGESIDTVLVSYESNKTGGDTTKTYQKILDRVRKFNVELLIIDPVADTFGGDEVKRIQVRNFIRWLDKIAKNYGVTVILTSHPSVSGQQSGSGLSGSTAWNNSVRSRLYLTRDDKSRDMRKLQVMKSNYGPTNHEINLTWDNGVFKACDNSLTRNPQQLKNDDETIYLSGLKILLGRDAKPSIHNNQGSYAPKAIAKLQGVKIGKGRLEQAQERLFDAGVIGNVADTSKSPSRQTKHIQIIDEEKAQKIIDGEFGPLDDMFND